MDFPSHRLNGSNWSKLPLELLRLVFERLGFADFQRVKSVCPSWQSAYTQSSPTSQVPWLILFPKKGKNQCLLFNSEEEKKMYDIRDVGINFKNYKVLATYGSWIFFRDRQCNLYISNIFTRERIDLPSVESQLGDLKIERTMDHEFRVTIEGCTFDIEDISIGMPVFWIDENTKDYVVMWSYRGLSYSRKGDNGWKQDHEMYDIADIVYKDHKLYIYSSSRDVKILDFSKDTPQQIFESQVNYNSFSAKGWRGTSYRVSYDAQGEPYAEVNYVRKIRKEHLVVMVTGDILRVKTTIISNSDIWSFRIYKMDSSNSKWEKLTSLGDEAILLDLGITILANTIEGIKRNSIYFSGGHREGCDHRLWTKNDIFIYNLNTHKVERPHQSVCSSIQLSDARWFVPNVKQK